MNNDVLEPDDQDWYKPDEDEFDDGWDREEEDVTEGELPFDSGNQWRK